jgi:hypothetical protein
MNHVTVGVYANGTYVVNIVTPKMLEYHVEYNKIMRFGRALFVDGECVNEGYLSPEQVNEWKQKISKMKIDNSVPSKQYH